MLRSLLLLSAALTVWAGLALEPARAADPNEFAVLSYDYRSDGSNPPELPGRLFIPLNYDPDQSYPLVVFLHGAGERGSDNTSQVNGNINNLLANAKTRHFFIYAPQVSQGDTSNGKFGNRWSSSFVDNAWRMAARVTRQYSIDPSRVYVTGLSMGGGGTWNSISRYTDVLAAATVICGASNTAGSSDAIVQAMVGKPIWAFHAVNDLTNGATVGVSRNQINAIRLQDGPKPELDFPLNSPGNPYYNDGSPFYTDGSTFFGDLNANHADANNLRYTEYSSGGHGIWGRVYNEAPMYAWLLAQSAGDTNLQPQETLLFDLGNAMVDSQDSQGNWWNSTSFGLHDTLEAAIAFAKTTTGRRTSVCLTVESPFGYHVGVNSTASPTPYDDAIGEDGWVTVNGATETANSGKIRLHGLVPGASYRLEIYAYHSNNDGGRGRSARYQSGAAVADLEAYNNTASTAVLPEVTADAAGEIVIATYATPNTTSRCGQINTLAVTRVALAANAAPNVNAGADAQVTLPDSLQLSGQATDDGLPSATLAVQWTQDNGPGAVAFANPADPQTTVTFPAAGTYVLRLTADDGALTVSDTVTVTVDPPANPGAGQVFFSQNFNASAAYADYASPSPNSGQFDEIDAEADGGAWSIVNGALQIARAGTDSNNPDNGAGFSRVTDIASDPGVLKIEFDMAMSIAPATWSSVFSLDLGNWPDLMDYNTGGSYDLIYDRLDVKGNGGTGYRLGVAGLYTSSIPADGASRKITWYVNKSGAPINYTGPDGQSYTLADHASSVWLDQIQLLDNIARQSFRSESMPDFRMRFSSAFALTVAFDNIVISDGLGGASGNQAPVAANDAIQTLEGVPLDWDVLANDSDPDSGPSALAVSAVSAPAHGTAQIAGTQVRYIPAPGYHGPDSFTYTVTDGTDTAQASVGVAVTQAGGLPAESQLEGLTIGAGANGSSQVLADDRWEINGSGAGVAGSADSFHYEAADVAGDFIVVARMNSLASSGAAPRAGVMVRETSAAGSRMAALATTTGSAYQVITRTAADAAASESTPAVGYAYPAGWVLLERVGEIITVAVSDDGLNYQEVGSVTLAGLAASVEVGVFASSGTAGANARAVVTDFAILPGTAIFRQNFNSAASVAAYSNPGNPTSNQFDDLSANTGGGAWIIHPDGKLAIDRAGTTSAAGFTRYTDLPSSSGVVLVEFDVAFNGTINDYLNMATLTFGNLTALVNYDSTIPAAAANSTSFLTLKGASGNQFRFLVGSQTTAATYPADGTPLHVAWYVNASGSNLSYTGPDGLSHSLPDLTSSLWINNAPILEAIPRPASWSSRALTDFRFQLGTPQSVVFSLDNLVIRDLL